MRGTVIGKGRGLKTRGCRPRPDGGVGNPGKTDMASILIVEDEELVGRMMVLNLRGEKHEVTWIKSAEEIEGAMEGRAYDLVIMDVMLPGEDGVSATQALRGRGYDGPLLMVTARNHVTDRVKGLQAGADDYLAKPFRLEELLARVQVLVRRRR